jgi:hypothetical protein
MGRRSRCSCQSNFGWENGPCDYCQGYTPCEGECGELEVDCRCDEKCKECGDMECGWCEVHQVVADGVILSDEHLTMVAALVLYEEAKKTSKDVRIQYWEEEDPDSQES